MPTNHAAQMTQAQIGNPASEGKLPRELSLFLAVSVACTALTILAVVLRFLFVHAPLHGLPATILSRWWFDDTFAYIRKVEIIHSPTMYTEGVRYYYPAPAIMVYVFLHFFAGASHNYLRSCFVQLAITLTGIFTAARGMVLGLERRGIRRGQALLFAIVTLVCSWPILYGIRQGNIETLLWLGVAAALWAYYNERWWLFAALIGFFGTAKYYPMLFLALCLRPKKFGPILFAVAIFAAVTLSSLSFLGPSIPEAYRRCQTGVHLFGTMNLGGHVIWPGSAMFEHSFCGLLHLLLDGHPNILVPILKVYMPGFALLALILWFARVWKLPAANQVLFITLVCISVPPISLDYTLEMMYVPFGFVVLAIAEAAHARRTLPGARAVMVCFALVMSPELFLYIHRTDIAGEFKAVILAAMWIVALRFPFPTIGSEKLTGAVSVAPVLAQPLPAQ